MSYPDFIIAICLAGFVQALIKESIPVKITSSIALLGLSGIWFPNPWGAPIENYVGACLFIFSLGSIGLTLLHMLEKESPVQNKILIMALFFGGIMPILFKMTHWPGAGFFSIISIIPIVFLCIFLAQKKISTKHILTGYLVFGLLCALNSGRMIVSWID